MESFAEQLNGATNKEIAKIQQKLKEELEATFRLAEKVVLSEPIETNIRQIEETRDNVTFLTSHLFQPQADGRVYYYYPNYGGRGINSYRSECYSAGVTEILPCLSEDRSMFFDHILTDEEKKKFDLFDLQYNVYRHEEQLIKTKKRVTHFGTDPYYVDRQSEGNIHLATIQPVFGEQIDRYLLYGEEVEIMRVQGEFCYYRVVDNSTEIVHCSSGKLLHTISDYYPYFAITGNDFVFFFSNDTAEAVIIR